MRKMPQSINSKLIAFLVFFILISDQISKWLVVKSMILGESRCVLQFFNIVMVKNKGITFGMFNGVIPSIVLILLSLIAIVCVFIWARRNRHCILPAALIIGGAIGNVIDRIIHGAVIDFLDFHLYGYHWPAFNIADSSIVIGATILFFISFGEKNWENKITFF